MSNTPAPTPNEERVHHPYSPSSLGSREACPKFQNRHSTNAAAVAGSIQHNMVETRSDDQRATDKHAFAVSQCIAFAEEWLAKYPGATVIQEIYLPVDDEMIVLDVAIVDRFDIVTEDGQISPGFRGRRERHVFEGTTAGYLDYAILSKDQTEAVIIDWKFGQNAVEEAGNNLQGISYMLGLKRLYPTLLKCRVIFMQPHIDDMSEHEFDLRNTDELYLRIRTVVGRAIEAAKTPADFSAARPNVGTCLFCAHVGKCPKVAELVIKLGQKYRPLQIPENVDPTTISDPRDVDTGLRLADVAKNWAESFRKQATEVTIEDPDFVPEGYTLVISTKRKMLDPKKVGDLAKTFLPEEDHAKVDALYDLPLGGVEELIQERAPRGQKEKTVEKFGAVLLDQKAVEMGSPFATLRQSKKSDKTKTAAK